MSITILVFSMAWMMDYFGMQHCVFTGGYPLILTGVQ
jgi:hypothetical protein